MKEQSFLTKLKDEKKLELIEPSEEVSKSYLDKSENCLKAAKILSQNGLYENSVIDTYYAMYDSLLSLFFRIGIKCENHSGSIILFKMLFNRDDLFKLISGGREERIDKQYYVTSKENIILSQESTKDMIQRAENFIIQIKLILKNLNLNDIKNLRNMFIEKIK